MDTRNDWSVCFKSKNWDGWKCLTVLYDSTEEDAKRVALEMLHKYCGTYDWKVVPMSEEWKINDE